MRYKELVKQAYLAKQPEGLLGVILIDGDEDKLYNGMAADISDTMEMLVELAQVRVPATTPYMGELERDYGLVGGGTSVTDEKVRRDRLAVEVYKRNGKGSLDDLQDALHRGGFTNALVHNNDNPLDPGVLVEDTFGSTCSATPGPTCTDLPEHTCSIASDGHGEYIVNGDIFKQATEFGSTCSATPGPTCTDLPEYTAGSIESQKNPVRYRPTKNFQKVFFVGGEITKDGSGNILDVAPIAIDERLRQEFRRIVLKYKPLDTWGAAIVDYIYVQPLPEEDWYSNPDTGEEITSNPDTGEEMKRIFFPLKDNDPFTLLEGQWGLQTVATGARAWYRPIRDDDADPLPDPIRLSIDDVLTTSIGEVPTGAVDSVNQVYTVSQDIASQDTALVLLNGVVRTPGVDFTIVGDTITMTFAPTTGSTLFVIANVVFSAGVSSFNGRSGVVNPASGDYLSSQVSDNSSVGGADTAASLDILKASIAATAPESRVVNAATFAVAATTSPLLILYVDYTATGGCDMELSSALIATPDVEILIIDRGAGAGLNNINITTEGAETINGDAAGASLEADRGVIRMVTDGSNVHITGGAV
jgi:hypothetical protein